MGFIFIMKITLYGLPNCAPCNTWGEKFKTEFGDNLEVVKFESQIQAREKFIEYKVNKVPFAVTEDNRVFPMETFPVLIQEMSAK